MRLGAGNAGYKALSLQLRAEIRDITAVLPWSASLSASHQFGE